MYGTVLVLHFILKMTKTLPDIYYKHKHNADIGNNHVEKILVAGNPACEQGLVYEKIFAVLIFAGSSMSTLTAKFKGCLYIHIVFNR